ncbi:MAG: crossover junction endodeoxyribonuclease RuvC [Coriobacteriia bacterium]|nr:crossover junction endodeoxyribonuclease RuvC [Coriobacteriia bacterium]
MVILGIDPGLANTGWGVIESIGSRHRCLAYGCITTTPGEALPARLASVYAELQRECAIESVYFGSNAKSAFATGQARGVAILALAERGLTLGEYSPVQIKSAVVGAGSADKSQVAYMMRVLLGLAEEPSPDHAADALAVAVCHSHLRGVRAMHEAAV